MVYPGQESTVSFKILIPRRRDKAATDLLDKGIQDYQKGFEQNYKKAADLFEQAFKMDPDLQPGGVLPGPDLQRPVR